MQLVVITYNIHRAIGVDRRFRLDRIIQILAHYNADVVFLQEVDSGVPRSRNLELARELAAALDYPHQVTGYNVRLRAGRYGNATLSRYPILESRNIDLSVDDRKRRGCQYARIRAEKVAGHPHTLETFNLHLGLSAQERARQIGLLVRSPEFSALGLEDRCLVAGDFNDWRTRLTPIFTEILGFRCATDHRYGYQRPIRTYPSFSPTGGLDKIFYRGRIRALGARGCRLGLSKVASDHLPVIGEFQLN